MLECLVEPETTSSIESCAWNIRNEPEVNKLVEDLCVIHNDLCDTSTIAGDYFATKMLFIIGTVFLTLLLNGYYVFLRFFVIDIGSSTKEAVEIIYFVFQCVMIFLGIIFACNTVHNIAQEVR